MKAVFAFVFVVIAVVAARPEDDDHYTTKYDDIDLDSILNNERLLKQHHECLMERGKCTKELVELKKVLKDALETDCSKCSAKQKEGAKKVLTFIHEKHLDNFNELKSKYDPEGKYIDKYRGAAAEAGIKV